MAASDGTLLNLAAQLAGTAAELQKTVSTRSGRATDQRLVAALDQVAEAIGSLRAAVVLLAEPGPEDHDA